MAVSFDAGETKQLDVGLIPIPVALATLQGFVTDADTSAPIYNVRVEVGGSLSTSTDTDGFYMVPNIPPGNYAVSFSHPNYETIEF